MLSFRYQDGLRTFPSAVVGAQECLRKMSPYQGLVLTMPSASTAQFSDPLLLPPLQSCFFLLSPAKFRYSGPRFADSFTGVATTMSRTASTSFSVGTKGHKARPRLRPLPTPTTPTLPRRSPHRPPPQQMPARRAAAETVPASRATVMATVRPCSSPRAATEFQTEAA